MKHRFLHILVFCLCTLTAMAYTQYDSEENNIYYHILSENTVEVTHETPSPYDRFNDQTYISPYNGSITIPATVTHNGVTYTVVAIGDYAYYFCRLLHSVTLPNTITRIGREAFRSTNITDINIPPSVTTIESGAFCFVSSLTTIYIPANVTSIINPFNACYLHQIEVDPANPAYMAIDGVLFSKDTTTLICYPAGKVETDYTIPATVTHIGSNAFAYGRNLTNLIIPNSVTHLDSEAFIQNWVLPYLYLPASVTNIGSRAFSCCSALTQIAVDADNQHFTSVDGVLFSKDSTTLYAYPAGKTETVYTIPNTVSQVYEFAFEHCNRLTNVIFPSSVTTLQRKLFYGCANIDNIVLPESITSMSDYIFQECAGLTHITLPNNLTRIPNGTFHNCSNLASITIPASVTRIGDNAFTNCTNLKTIHNCSALPLTIGSTEYGYVAQHADQILECSYFAELSPSWKSIISTDVYKTVTDIRVSVDAYALPEGVNVATDTTDAIIATLNGTILTFTTRASEIYLPRNSAHLFEFTQNPETQLYETVLQSIDLQHFNTERVAFMTSMFFGCQALRQLDLSHFNTANVTEMSWMFYFCSSLTSLDLSNFNTSQTVYMEGMFNNCQSLVSLDLSSFNTDRLISMYGMFTNCMSLTTIDLHSFNTSHVTSMYRTFGSCQSLTALDLSGMDLSAVTDMGYMLHRCSSLTELHTPAVYPTDIIVDLPDHNNEQLYWQITGIGGTYTDMLTAPQNSVLSLTPMQQFTLTTLAPNGSITGGGIYDYGTEIHITATPDEHYVFTQWSDGETANPRIFTITQDTTFTAEFALEQFTLTTTAQNGSITGAGVYDYGTEITLTATPDEHYIFTQWSDGDTSNPRIFTITQDTTFTAEFALEQFTLTTTAQNGSITGAGVYDYGTEITITATPDEHYIFTQWSDGETANPRIITITQDTTFTAEFKLIVCLEISTPDTLPDLCADETTLVIPFTLYAGEMSTATLYITDGSGGIVTQLPLAIDTDNQELTANITSLRVGQYQCLVVIDDSLCGQPYIQPLDFTIRYASTIITQKWDDLLSLLNTDHNGGYTFIDFQWYKNGEPIPGATNSYYYSPTPFAEGEEYSILLIDETGKSIMSCPYIVKSNPSTSLSTPTAPYQSINVRIGIYNLHITSEGKELNILYK